ncbi:integral plasma membrane protein [Scheffersomyces xylosifermentans]|uniref:integral plasma membrane protein n=1 Tax=Scheffersomyces xylosifermentans TaxID=1304137 RepID=UPI00315C6390
MNFVIALFFLAAVITATDVGYEFDLNAEIVFPSDGQDDLQFNGVDQQNATKRNLEFIPQKKYSTNSQGLQEFTPIRDTIVQSGTNYYSFSVNTTTGLGEYYEFLIFLTGNICSQPPHILNNETSLAVYYSFNASMMTNMEVSQMVLFHNGYLQALADVPIQTNDEVADSILYIAVRAPENTNRTAQWSYQIGVSQNDLVFQWDDRSWASLIDTDDDSALVVTGNLTNAQGQNISELNATESQFSLYIYSYDYNDYFTSINSSWCAVRNGPALIRPEEIQSSYTTRNGALQQQFYVTGLNASTKYIAYLISDFSGVDFGGAVYSPFEFETLDSPSCELIYDLDFCDQIAYSVPASSKATKEEIMSLYDNRARDLYVNFTKALQQIPCDTLENAVFSPMKTCKDCADSYKDWLCAVTIPRCSTRNITGYKERAPGNSRNDYINEVIQPDLTYFEVMPCVNVCEAIVRDCPADFGFMCPIKNESISLSYFWDNGGDWPTCNYVGKYAITASSAALRAFVVNGWLLATVVFCMVMM